MKGENCKVLVFVYISLLKNKLFVYFTYKNNVLFLEV